MNKTQTFLKEIKYPPERNIHKNIQINKFQ